MSIRRLLFSFHGRIPRRIFWYYTLALFAIFLAAAVMDSALRTAGQNGLSCGTSAVILLCALPTVAVGVKRCHDRDHRGWFLALGLVPFSPFWLWILLGLPRGTSGDNRFGADPLEPVDPVH